MPLTNNRNLNVLLAETQKPGTMDEGECAWIFCLRVWLVKGRLYGSGLPALESGWNCIFSNVNVSVNHVANK